jgi:leucyl-tRNA synthetase
MAEEIWQRLGRTESLTYMPFPKADPQMLVHDTIEIPVQVNGKMRSKLSVSADVSDDELRSLAMADEKVVQMLAGATPSKIIVVPKRLVNIVL